MQYDDSQLFATSSVLQFVLYRTRCTACVLTQQFRMDLPLPAGVRPRSPPTAPRPGSPFLSVPTHCGPPSRSSSPSVPSHSAPTRAVVPLRTHPMWAAEPQEFALGPRP